MKRIVYIMRRMVTLIRNKGNLKISLFSRLGKGVSIITSNGRIKIGDHFAAVSNVHLSAIDGGMISIGENVNINRNCIFVSRKQIKIGSNCGFGPNVCIYDHDHNFGHGGTKEGYSVGTVEIGERCWIGAGCIILRDTHIGSGCVIGAGCIVKGNIPDNSLVTMERKLIIRELKDR